MWADLDWSILYDQLFALIFVCENAHSFVFYGENSLRLTSLITIETISEQAFDALINLAINRFIRSPMNEFYQIQMSMVDMLQANQFRNQYMTTWRTEFSSSNENDMLRNLLTSFADGTCTCAAAMWNCTRSLVVQDSNGNLFIFTGSHNKGSRRILSNRNDL